MRAATKVLGSFAKRYQGRAPKWGPAGYVVFKRTYARCVPGSDRTEEWHETVERVCNGALAIGARYTQDEVHQLYDHLFNLRALPGGRCLWQLGTEVVERVGADSLCNCWCVAVDDPVEPFCFAFNQLMLGGGVGYNLCHRYVSKIPPVRFTPSVREVSTPDCDFVVPDNREGWVELVRRVLVSHYHTGARLHYYTGCVRPKGTPIRTFGGVASGPGELVKGVSAICQVLAGRVGQRLRPIDALDLMNVIGSVVVSGNVRRSAQIAIGDPGDLDYLRAKRWDLGQVPAWRGMSNNTVDCPDPAGLPQEFWEGYQGNGEPYGLINLENCRRYGRLTDGADTGRDPTVIGCNPCAEISLEDCEPCNLSELVLPNIASTAQLCECAYLLHKMNKAVACYTYSDPKTQEVVWRNKRIGIGVTGYLQASAELRSPAALQAAYRTLRAQEERGDQGLSIKLTTVKPSGTLSLLPGVTAGGHPAYAQYLIRRVTFATGDPLAEACRQAGYKVEPRLQIDGQADPSAVVVEFPVATPQGTTLAAQMSAVDQLEVQRQLQTWWADNSVSMTVYYRREELSQIRQWLQQHYSDQVKTVSFLLHQGHGFKQAPLEPISAEQYKQAQASVRPLSQVRGDRERDLASLEGVECESGHCPVR